MKLGFLTGCLSSDLTAKLDFASKTGFGSIEISCWPKINNRDYSGCDIDVENFTQKEADELKKKCKALNLTISSLAYYDNMLHPDLAIRKNHLSHLKSVIRVAQLLGVGLVGTFVGKNQDLSLEDNFDLFEEIFSDLTKFAAKHNVKLMIENCPMPGWQIDGLPATLSYSPEFWDEMFRRVPNKNFGLNFDPSHLHWLKIDYLSCLEKYKERIFHVHAKDCTVNEKMFSHYGIFGKKLNRQHPEDLGWFAPKIPGLGDISWLSFIEKLRQVGYDEFVSIELEDRDLNDDMKIKEGLIYSFNHLNPLINGFGSTHG